MELKLNRGDYVADAAGALCSVSGTEALIQRALMRLSARRGSFLPQPEYGSRLYSLGRLKPGERAAAARQYAIEALEAEPLISVGEVEYLTDADGAAVNIELICGGQHSTASLRV